MKVAWEGKNKGRRRRRRGGEKKYGIPFGIAGVADARGRKQGREYCGHISLPFLLLSSSSSLSLPPLLYNYPTNNVPLINFFLSSDAETLLIITD